MLGKHSHPQRVGSLLSRSQRAAVDDAQPRPRSWSPPTCIASPVGTCCAACVPTRCASATSTGAWRGLRPAHPQTPWQSGSSGPEPVAGSRVAAQPAHGAAHLPGVCVQLCRCWCSEAVSGAFQCRGPPAGEMQGRDWHRWPALFAPPLLMSLPACGESLCWVLFFAQHLPCLSYCTAVLLST